MPDTVKITLVKPIKIDGKAVKDIELRDPNAGELRGLKMMDILSMDVDAMAKLLPRITTPSLTPDQIFALPASDFTALTGKTLLFFANEDQLDQIRA